MSATRKIVLGIDLGTTYSCMAAMDEAGHAALVPNGEGNMLTPSMVFFDPSGDFVEVGQIAKEMVNVYPSEVASFIKRRMGDDEFRFSCKKGCMRPEEISAYILKKLVTDISEASGSEIRDVVITYPSYFSVKGREATRKAGDIAGLNVIQLLNEPTAVAVAYRNSRYYEKPENVLICDFGGGSFQACAALLDEKGVQIVRTDGDPRLGGVDIDERIARRIAEKFAAEKGMQLRELLENAETFTGIMQKAETVKKSLGFVQKKSCKVLHGEISARVEVSRAELDELSADIFEQAAEIAVNVAENSREDGFDRIDNVLMTGGVSRMPQFGEALRKKLEGRITGGILLFEVDSAAAKGAAIVGRSLLDSKESSGPEDP